MKRYFAFPDVHKPQTKLESKTLAEVYSQKNQLPPEENRQMIDWREKSTSSVLELNAAFDHESSLISL